jgi:hypothetical protein
MNDAGFHSGEPDEPPVDERAARAPGDPYEGAVPPGYDWPTHGGYLGCLIGLMASCLIGAFLGSTLFAALSCTSPIPGDTLIQGCHPLLPGVVSALLTLAVFAIAAILLAWLGWNLGKRFLREYPQPRPTWGESDEADDTYATDRSETPTAEGTEAGASSDLSEHGIP